MSPLMPSLNEALHRDYAVHEYWEIADKSQFFGQQGSKIEAIVTRAGAEVSETLMKQLPALEIVASFSVGLDHVDLTSARELRIAVTNTPEVLNDAVADTALALLLATTRRICLADRYVREGKWVDNSFPLGVGLRGKVCGIVGLGGIGREIASRAQAFGLEVRYHGPRKKNDVPYRYYESLEELACDSDFLILSLPGGEATKHVIDRKILRALGQQGILINVARGSVVNERDLVEALNSNDIAGAGLDVFENEPRVPDELKTMENVVLLPHIASGTVETREAMAQLVLDNLRAHFEGRPLVTPV